MTINEQLFTALHGMAGSVPAVDAGISFAATGFAWVMLALLVVWGVLHLKRSGVREAARAAAAIGGSVVIAAVIVLAVREMFPVARPFTLPDIESLVPHEATPGFPSGHAILSFAPAAAVFLRDRKAGTAFLAGAVILSLARVAAGLHWPADVLAGAAFGVLAATIATRVIRAL